MRSEHPVLMSNILKAEREIKAVRNLHSQTRDLIRPGLREGLSFDFQFLLFACLFLLLRAGCALKSRFFHRRGLELVRDDVMPRQWRRCVVGISG